MGNGILHIDQTGDVQLAGKAAGIVHHGVDLVLRQVLCRIDTDGVAGVHAGALHLLHDAGDEVVLAVADGVHSHSVPMMYLSSRTGWSISTCSVMTPMYSMTSLGVSHDHVLTAEDVGRTHQNRQADLVGCGQSLFQIEDSAAGCAGDAAALQQLVEALTVFGLVDGIRRGAEDGQTDLVHMLCQLDGSLTAKLNNAASGFSVAMMLSTLSGFSGSKYRRSPVSKSVETVSGLLLTRMASQPCFLRVQTQ